MGNVLTMNAVFVCGKDKIYELTEFDEDNFIDHTVYYVGEEGLKAFSDKGGVKDFDLKDGFVLWRGKETVGNSEIIKYKNNRLDITHTKENLMDYLLILANAEARILSEKAANTLITEKTFPTEGVSKISSIKGSSSTMRLYVSYIEDKRWHSFSIVEMDEHLKFNPFVFVVRSDLTSEINTIEYATKLAEMEIKGVSYTLYSMDENTPLYVDFSINPGINACMINHKMYSMELYRICALAAFSLRDSIEVSLGIKKDPEVEESPWPKKTTDKRGVHFKYDGPTLNRSEIKRCLQDSITFKAGIMSGKETINTIVVRMQEARESHIYINTAYHLVNVLMQDSRDMTILLDFVSSLQTEQELKALRIQLEFMALRMMLFVTDTPLPNYASSYTMTGGASPGYTEIRRI